jgi:hypothetical protein
MCICIQHIFRDGPKMNTEILDQDLSSGFVWLVGRRVPKPDPDERSDWHIQGVTSREDIAIEMCEDETYFIGPLPLNMALPRQTVQWVGLYFPLGPNIHNTDSGA